MANTQKLKGMIVEKGYNLSNFAENIGIHPGTLYRKINSNGETFTIKEATQIVETLKLTRAEAESIFFGDVVA